jgi:hypothetical protein
MESLRIRWFPNLPVSSLVGTPSGAGLDLSNWDAMFFS